MSGILFVNIFFCDLIVIYKCISMILSDFFFIVLLLLVCQKLCIAKNHALFGLTIFSL